MRRRVGLKDIKIVQCGGKRWIYRRVNGRLVPLPDLPENHPDFLAAYVAAGKAPPAPKRKRAKVGTIGALCRAYMASGAYNKLAASTRGNRARIIRKIEDKAGDALLADLRPDHIRKDVRALSAGAGGNRLKVWRALMRFAVAEGLLPADLSEDVAAQEATVQPHEQWQSADLGAFRARWPVGTPQRIAFEVIQWTGAACVDAVALGWQKERDGWLHYNRSKSGGAACCPLTAPLPSWCAALRAERAHLLDVLPRDVMLWLSTAHGRPRSHKSISQWISAAARDAGLVGLTAHGLRKYRAARLAEIGATPHQIGAWIGDTSLGMVAHYTRGADRRAVLETLSPTRIR